MLNKCSDYKNLILAKRENKKPKKKKRESHFISRAMFEAVKVFGKNTTSVTLHMRAEKQIHIYQQALLI